MTAPSDISTRTAVPVHVRRSGAVDHDGFAPRPYRRGAVGPLRTADPAAFAPAAPTSPLGRGAAAAWSLDFGASGLAAVGTTAAGVPLPVAVATLAGWCMTLMLLGDTTVRRLHPRTDVPLRAFVGLLGLAAVLVVVLGADLVRLHQVAGVAAAVAAASIGVRMGLGLHRGPARVLVLGGQEPGRAEPPLTSSGARIVGSSNVDAETGEIGPAQPWPATVGDHQPDLVAAVAAWRVDVVAVAPDSGLTAAAIRRLGWQLEDLAVDLAFLDDLESVAPHRLTIGDLGGRPLVMLGPARPSRVVLAVKFLVDRLVGAVLLAAVLPLLVALAVLVRSDSCGPALFRQTRIGRHGRPFTLYKLRTMCSEAESLKVALVPANEADAVLFKIRRDPRVTRFGRWLRRTSLDELPQLLNVVRGDMSLVGPRPALPEEVTQYDALARRRLAVRPGITGLWQINGRSDLDWQRSVDLDVLYTDNITISGDLAICLRTVRAVAGGKGAY
jgi:exopolysaccharide biosynthesis polyprenyl glycosylphosphotransferase